MASSGSSWDELEERLASAGQIDEVATAVLAMVRHLKVSFQSCVILLRDGDKLSPVLSQTPYRDVLAMAHLLDLHEPLVDEVLESGQSRLAEDLATNSQKRIFKDERSVICASLAANGNSLGVLYLGATAPKIYEATHLDRLEVIAGLAASALNSMSPTKPGERNPTASERKTAQLDALRELARGLSMTWKSREVMSAVTELVRGILPSAQSVILFSGDIDDATGHALKAEYAF